MDRVIEHASTVFYVPGNYLLSVALTHAPPLARFLGISNDDYSGVLAGILSTIAWLGAAMLIGVVLELVRAADRAVTQAWTRLYRDTARRMRALRTWAISHAHRLRERMRSPRPESQAQVGVLNLTALELAVLHSHARLRPGFMLTRIDISRAHGVRAVESQLALSKLRDCGLLERSFGARDQEEGYVLTTMGRSFLAALEHEPPQALGHSLGSGGR